LEKTRLEILMQFVENKPNDLFTRYGLAMEYARLGEHDKALENFRKLWEQKPDYAAAYFQAGQLLTRMGRLEEARRVLGKGIEAAGRIGDLHAKSEMEAALGELRDRD
jgi:tetratricopeptide (TPR) repeat protein